MAKESPRQVMTAYRLVDGFVIYVAKDGWTEWVEEAQIATSPEEADALTARAKEAEARNEVFETYLIEVTTDGRTWPVTMREIMRAQGPTIHPQFGKQADRDAARAFATQRAGAKNTERGERRDNREG